MQQEVLQHGSPLKEPSVSFFDQGKATPSADIGDPYLPEGLSLQGEGNAEAWPKDDAMSISAVNFCIRSSS
jgi:hypothetical protein